MPIGVIVNVLSVAAGGLIGSLTGNLLTEDFKEKTNMIFGCCSMAMGISSIVLMENMPAVVFSVIIGTMLGLCIHLGDRITDAGRMMQKAVNRILPAGSSKIPQEEFNATLVTIIVLFCASGTGIYGSLVAGMSGDHSILFAKSILDLFTAMIFACTLGAVVMLVAIPQFIIFMLLFALGGMVIPHTADQPVLGECRYAICSCTGRINTLLVLRKKTPQVPRDLRCFICLEFQMIIDSISTLIQSD